MAARKQKSEDLEVGEVCVAKECATVHGIETELSPIKTSKKGARIKYFFGNLSDGKKSMQMISFDTQLWPRLQDSLDTVTCFAVKDCKVKDGSTGTLEIIATWRMCAVESSPKKLKLPENFQRIFSKQIHIEELDSLAVMQAQRLTKKGKMLRDIGIADQQKAGKQGRDDSIKLSSLPCFPAFC